MNLLAKNGQAMCLLCLFSRWGMGYSRFIAVFETLAGMAWDLHNTVVGMKNFIRRQP